MNNRERFKHICKFERPNDFFTIILQCWNETYDRWVEEGMTVKNTENPKETNMYFMGYSNQSEFLKINGALWGLGKCYNPPWVPPLVPLFDIKVIKDDGEYVEMIEQDGCLVRKKKSDNYNASLPQYISYPVIDRKSWEAYKKRLDPFTPERWPKGWDIMSDADTMWPLKPEHEGKHWEERDFVLGMVAYSGVGGPRNYMGLENFSFAQVDDIKLIEDMLDWQAYLAFELLKKVFAAGVKPDWVLVWEDICFNKGPLISPKFFREFVVPRYKKITEFLHDNGVDIIVVDSDGNNEELLPLWIDAGVTGISPLECAAGNDARVYRKKFGKNLILCGNIDKRALASGKTAIDGEIAKAKELMAQGGYLPACDHMVPPDVSFENIKYFFNELYKLSEYPELRREII